MVNLNQKEWGNSLRLNLGLISVFILSVATYKAVLGSDARISNCWFLTQGLGK